MQDFLTFIGHGFCHQIHERTFESGGLFFAVCARDTGLHLGLAFALLVAFALYARTKVKPGDLPATPVIIIIVFMALPLVFDGLSSYLGFRTTTNTIRFITGLFCGTGVGTLLAPFLLGLRQNADSDKRAFTKPAVAAAQLLAPLALGLIFLGVYPLLGVVSPFVDALSFIGIVMSVNLLLLSLAQRLHPTGKPKLWLVCLGLSFVLAAAEISLMALIREVAFTALFGSSDVPWL